MKSIVAIVILAIAPLLGLSQQKGKVTTKNKVVAQTNTAQTQAQEPTHESSIQEVKFLSDFIKRFNYEAFNANQPLTDSLKKLYAREVILKQLFNEDDTRLKSSKAYQMLREQFIAEVVEKNYHIDNRLTVEAKLPIIVQIGEQTDTLLVALKKYYTSKQAAYWQVIGVVPPRLLPATTIPQTYPDTLKRQDLLPNEHEVHFLSLLQGIRAYKGICVFASKEVTFTKDWLTVETALHNNQIQVLHNATPQLTFTLQHWQLTLDYFSRESSNAGWLLSNIKMIEKKNLEPKLNKDSVYAYIMNWTTKLNTLSITADSLAIQQQQKALFQAFMPENTLVPDWFANKKTFFDKHPKVTFKAFVSQLPSFFWEGLHIDINADKLQIDTLKHVKEATYQWKVTFPYTFRGILAQSKEPHVLKDTLTSIIQANWINNEWTNLSFIDVQSYGKTIPGATDILTQANAQVITQQIQDALVVILNKESQDSTRNKACETLNKVFDKNLHFFIKKGDKVLDSLGINNCRPTKTYTSKQLSKLKITRLDIACIDSFHEGANGFIVGNRTLLEGVTPFNTDKWYTTKQENVPIKVESPLASKQAYIVLVSNIIIQI